MNTINIILLVILINIVPFIWYNYKEIKVTNKQTIIYGILSIIITYLIMSLTDTKGHYIELFSTGIISTLFNLSIFYGITNIKKIPKSTLVFILFFTSSIFQLIPASILNYDLNNLTNSQTLILTCFSDIVLLCILIIIYFKDLKEEFKKVRGNLYSILDTGFKYWLLGLIVMMISNVIIGLFIKQAQAVNEEGVQDLIKSSSYLSIFIIGIIAPVVEELTFRKSFRDLFKNDIAFVLISGFIFGAAHMAVAKDLWDLIYIIPYTSLGIVFAYMYKKTDTVFTSMFMHMFHNTVLTILSVIGMGVILL